jgi:arylsulfatase A
MPIRLKIMVMVVTILTIASAGCTGQSYGQPNVLLIVVDDLGWMDTGIYGSTFYETPNIDSLATEGMRFTNAYSACTVCSPSRAALLTGKSPARLQFTGHITAVYKHRYPEHGAIIPPDDRMYIPLEEVTIAEALKPAGYVSASIGKWHVGIDERYYPTRQGFDVNIAGSKLGSPAAYFYPYKNSESSWNPDIPNLHDGKEGEYLTDRLTDEAIAFIREQQASPFFVYLPYFSVHTPLQAPGSLVKKYEQKLQRDSSQKSAVYGAMVERVDWNIGRLLQTLHDLQLEEQTIVIFTSDNGGSQHGTNNAPLREGKGYMYEGGLRIPLIVKWPGQTAAGSVTDAPVISHDLFPTICNMIEGAQSGPALEGRSLTPILTGGAEFPERMLFWYYPHYSPQAGQPGAVVREGNYKLIHHYDPERLELFNLADDVSERHDLSSILPDKAQALDDKLTAWLQQVNAKMHTPNPEYRPN